MIPLSSKQRHYLRVAAHVFGVGGVLVFLWLAITRGIPYGAEGDVLGVVAEPAQVALLVLVAVGWSLAWRYPAIAAAIVAVGGGALGFFSSVQYSPRTAALVTLCIGLPAVFLWLAWQHGKSNKAITALAIVTASLLVIELVSAQNVFNKYFGPKHPQSKTAVALKSDAVDWFWSGGVTNTSASVAVKLKKSNARLRVGISTSSQLNDLVWSQLVSVTNSHATVALDGLKPDTQYFYVAEVDGRRRDETVGLFHTPTSAAISFSFAAASCARTGSNGSVFDAIAAAKPQVFLITGDMHYANIQTADVGEFDNAYDRVLKAPAQQAMHRSVPIAYVWDDHDFGGNNADGTSKSKPAAFETYERNVPHYPLPVAGTLAQSFDIGRVHFVMMDTRAQRTPSSATDDANKTMLGKPQLEWLKQQLIYGRDHAALTVLVNPDPWIEPAGKGDSWGGYATERKDISSFIANNNVRNILMIAGDAHMDAIDDGSHTDYSGTGKAGFPLMQAAALDRPGEVKGGPYSFGTFPGAGQFGLVDVKDSGSSINVMLEGKNWKNETLTKYEFKVDGQK